MQVDIRQNIDSYLASLLQVGRHCLHANYLQTLYADAKDKF